MEAAEAAEDAEAASPRQAADPAAEPWPEGSAVGEWGSETESEDVAVSSDWLDRICPYLLSEDGTSRSAQPDERHRCLAQDPPGTLPLLFQERFCLTDRHVRCEMYKHAEGARSMALAQDSIPAEQVRSARFRPSVRSRPIALEPTASDAEPGRRNPLADRPVLIAVIGAGGLAVVLMALALLFGGQGPAIPPPDASPSAPAVTPPPVATSVPVATVGPVASPDGPLASAPARARVLIRYQLQEGERLVRVAEKWGTTRFAIVQANSDGDDPREARTDDVIIVPVPADMPADQIEATPGFLGYAPE
jgi:hypothetical protein